MNKELAEALVPVIKLLLNEHVDTGNPSWEIGIYDGFHGNFGVSLSHKNKCAEDLKERLLWRKINKKLKVINVSLYAGIVNDAYVIRMKTIDSNPQYIQLDMFQKDKREIQKSTKKLSWWGLLKNKISFILNKISLLRQTGFFFTYPSFLLLLLYYSLV